MVIEKEDVAALRLAEARGWFATEGEIARAGLSGESYAERLRKLSSLGVIRAFRATLVVPPLMGGDWVWAAVLANAKRALGVANALVAKLPFVTEIVLNSSLPERLGPNLALSFYSRDFDTEARFIQATAGLEYQEVVRIAEYSFPVAVPLSSDEKELVRFLVRNPAATMPEIGAGLGRNPAWVRAKIDRLLWSEANRSGVVRTQLELNWAPVENFGHCHFLLETGHRPDQLERLVAEEGYRLVFGGRPYAGRYVQAEADVWGLGRLMDSVTFLNQIAGIRVAGVLWNREVLVNDKWVAGLV